MLARTAILGWLEETRSEQLAWLFRWADEVRREAVGDLVHLRGLIELSNHCCRDCSYCGLRRSQPDLPRYRLTMDEIMASAREAVALGYGSVVLQSGDDPELREDFISQVIQTIRAETPLAITLSLGERKQSELVAWRRAGAERYFLRFESSNPSLLARYRPARLHRGTSRIALLHCVRELGYEVGSGIMVGLPGQTLDDLARDICLFRELDLDMIGVGPYIAAGEPIGPAAGERQVPASAAMTRRVVALARVTCPDTNIPGTTALVAASTTSAGGPDWALDAGSNVIMPPLTPEHQRRKYRIYPKPEDLTDAANVRRSIAEHIARQGRLPGLGPGASLHWQRRVGSTVGTRREPPEGRVSAEGGTRHARSVA